MDYSPQGRVFEGMAEAFRYILTGTMERSPKAEAIEWLRETVDQHPKFGPAMRKAVEQYKSFQDQGLIQQARSAVGGGAPKDLEWKEQLSADLLTAADRAYAELFNDTQAMRRFSDEIKKRRLGKTGEATPDELLALYRGTVDKRSARMVIEGPMSLTRPGVVYGPAMSKALESLTSEQDFKDAEHICSGKAWLVSARVLQFWHETRSC